MGSRCGGNHPMKSVRPKEYDEEVIRYDSGAAREELNVSTKTGRRDIKYC